LDEDINDLPLRRFGRTTMRAHINRRRMLAHEIMAKKRINSDRQRIRKHWVGGSGEQIAGECDAIARRELRLLVAVDEREPAAQAVLIGELDGQTWPGV
jgi:hypothetical protein